MAPGRHYRIGYRRCTTYGTYASPHRGEPQRQRYPFSAQCSFTTTVQCTMDIGRITTKSTTPKGKVTTNKRLSHSQFPGTVFHQTYNERGYIHTCTYPLIISLSTYILRNPYSASHSATAHRNAHHDQKKSATLKLPTLAGHITHPYHFSLIIKQLENGSSMTTPYLRYYSKFAKILKHIHSSLHHKTPSPHIGSLINPGAATKEPSTTAETSLYS